MALDVGQVLEYRRVPCRSEQLLVEQTSKVTLPVSWLSGSMKVAVRVGVAVFRRAASAGLTRVGVDGRSEERRVGKECRRGVETGWAVERVVSWIGGWTGGT